MPTSANALCYLGQFHIHFPTSALHLGSDLLQSAEPGIDEVTTNCCLSKGQENLMVRWVKRENRAPKIKTCSINSPQHAQTTGTRLIKRGYRKLGGYRNSTTSARQLRPLDSPGRPVVYVRLLRLDLSRPATNPLTEASTWRSCWLSQTEQITISKDTSRF